MTDHDFTDLILCCNDCTESSRTSDILVQATTENLKIWKKEVPIISDKYKRQAAKHDSRTWDFAVFTPPKQVGLYEIAHGRVMLVLCGVMVFCRSDGKFQCSSYSLYSFLHFLFLVSACPQYAPVKCCRRSIIQVGGGLCHEPRARARAHRKWRARIQTEPLF